MKVSIQEIAHQAGVSRGTVDRVIHRRGRVSKEVEARIWSIIKKNGYELSTREPSVKAVKKRNYIKIGVLIPYGNHPFFKTVIQGFRSAEQDYKQRNVSILFEVVNSYEANDNLRGLNRLIKQQVDGLCVTTVDDVQIRSFLNRIIKQGMPVITTNSDLPYVNRLCYVGCNPLESGQLAAGMFGLLSGSCANIMIMTGSPLMRMHNQRVQGFFEGVCERLEHVRIVEVAECADCDEIAYQQTKKTLTRLQGVTGIYIAAAGISGVCSAVQDLGFAGKIKIVCHDSAQDTIQLLKNNIISATICQEGFLQGLRSTQLMTDYLFTGQAPDRDAYFTHSLIKIKENF